VTGRTCCPESSSFNPIFELWQHGGRLCGFAVFFGRRITIALPCHTTGDVLRGVHRAGRKARHPLSFAVQPIRFRLLLRHAVLYPQSWLTLASHEDHNGGDISDEKTSPPFQPVSTRNMARARLHVAARLPHKGSAGQSIATVCGFPGFPESCKHPKSCVD